jgi:hypothetical protein
MTVSVTRSVPANDKAIPPPTRSVSQWTSTINAEEDRSYKIEGIVTEFPYDRQLRSLFAMAVVR